MLTRLRKSPIENISLINLVNEILEVFKNEIEQKELNVNVIIKENAYIELPYEYAKVLFYNLISNSIKYSEKGKDVYITGEYEGKRLKVGVADEGIGMTDQEIKNIFSDTYKDYFDKFHISSIGVGLSVVKIICDIHGIEIDLKSKKGIGTIVELVFPEAVSNQS
jgi:signal transduction histidine kinase